MKHVARSTLAALLLTPVLATGALAGSEDVVVENAWSRASIGTSRPCAAFMEVRNAGDEAVTLTGLRSDLAMMSEIHRVTTDARGVSTMAPAGAIVIAPEETVAVAPGVMHVMLMHLRRPMQEGESFPLTLTFSDGGKVTVAAPVLGIAARGPEG
ncbi:copper chaperone PCu(A)C [uncultured Jannaschia sp.]|uniref:copper chaperone PCu(A)C n=1 Tax=uncultured Jannaschia sp. TaxID=293347 RepID=UPI0026053DD1|nr:copper chaperone PCu(A)C [uncultured Jannaschia sp.]